MPYLVHESNFNIPSKSLVNIQCTQPPMLVKVSQKYSTKIFQKRETNLWFTPLLAPPGTRRHWELFRKVPKDGWRKNGQRYLPICTHMCWDGFKQRTSWSNPHDTSRLQMDTIVRFWKYYLQMSHFPSNRAPAKHMQKRKEKDKEKTTKAKRMEIHRTSFFRWWGWRNGWDPTTARDIKSTRFSKGWRREVEWLEQTSIDSQ